jgi:O-antigen ligase
VVLNHQLGQLINLLFSFEFVFVLYLYAGQFKTDPRLAWVPVDLSLLMFLVSLLYGAFELIRLRRNLTRVHWLFVTLGVLFVGWGILSSVWSPAFTIGGPTEAYARNKLVFFGAFGLWAFGAGSLIIATSPQRINRFALALVLASIPYCIGTFTYERENYWDSVIVFGSNYLSIGRVVGAGLVVILYYLLFRLGSVPGQIILLLTSFVYAAALISSGARTPLLASGICFILLMLASIRFSSRWKFPLIGTLLAVSALIPLLSLVPGNELRSLNRLQLAIEGQDRGSAEKRVEFLQDSLKVIRGSSGIIAGIGLGSWATQVNQNDFYPHNIVVEILIELGLVGLTLFSALLILALRCFAVSPLPERYLWLALGLYFLVNELVSGNLHNSSKSLFFVIAMAPALLANPNALWSKR